MARLEIGASVQIADNVSGTVAADVALVSITALRQGGAAPKYVLIQIAKRGGSGDVTLPGPVRLIGTCAGRRVILAGTLNGGSDIVVGADGGFQEFAQAVALCTAVALRPGGGLTGGGTPAFDAWVISVWGAP